MRDLADTYGAALLTIALDVRDRKAATAAVAAAVAAFGRLAGIITFPTAAIYNATKWAVEGLGETLAAKVADFGIKVTLIDPGGYDIDWRGSSSTPLPRMSDYDGLRNRLAAANGARKLGNPATTAEAILLVVNSPAPPLRLFLGEAALGIALNRYADRLATWVTWADVSGRS